MNHEKNSGGVSFERPLETLKHTEVDSVEKWMSGLKVVYNIMGSYCNNQDEKRINSPSIIWRGTRHALL